MRTDLQSWAESAVKSLEDTSEFPYIESQVLLSFTLNQSREWIIAHPEEILTEEQLNKLGLYVDRLKKGEPLPYITGIQAFYGLDFNVNPAVLIPRPETELLVEEALSWLQKHPNRRSALDVGTGSGAIAISLADQVSDLKLTAVDVSQAALDVAKKNAEKFSVEDRVQLLLSNLFEHVSGSFDLIAANLPYIPSEKLKNLPVSRYEPALALDGGTDGLDLIREFLKQAQTHIRPSGLVLVEIESEQGESAVELAQDIWNEGTISLIKDYAGLPRLVVIQAG